LVDLHQPPQHRRDNRTALSSCPFDLDENIITIGLRGVAAGAAVQDVDALVAREKAIAALAAVELVLRPLNPSFRPSAVG
jgi:hypothetical protein